MKLQYIVLGGISAGISNKLSGKLGALSGIVGHLRLTVISRSDPQESLNAFDVSYCSYCAPGILNKLPFFWRSDIWFERMMLSYAFYREVKRMDRDDIILLRYPGADCFLNTAFRLLGRRIFVFEHNTKELNELKLRKHGSYWFTYLYRMEKRYGSSLRNMASALVAVTSDFLDYQRVTYNCNVTGRVISNGYPVTDTRRRVLTGRGDVHFLMLIGSYAEWHGLEIFARAMAEADGRSYYLHVVGNVPKETIARITNSVRNIVFHGEKDFDSRQAIAADCHIGVGALGLAKLDIHTGSSLKVREYLALGMPVIVSVNDEDVHEEAFDQKYAMRVRIENDSFDLHGVVEFFGIKIYEQQHVDRIREYALRHVDYSIKAQQYLEFFRYLMPDNKKQV